MRIIRKKNNALRLLAGALLGVVLFCAGATSAQALHRESTFQEWLQADPVEQERLIDLFLLSIRYATPKDVERFSGSIKGHHIFAVRDDRIQVHQIAQLLRRERPQTEADLNRQAAETFLLVLARIDKVPAKGPLRLRDREVVEAEQTDAELFGSGAVWAGLLIAVFVLLMIISVIVRPTVRKSASAEEPDSGGAVNGMPPETIPGLRAAIADLQHGTSV